MDIARCAALEAMGGKFSAKEINEMIDQADADGDGVIDFEEFRTVMGHQSASPAKGGKGVGNAKGSGSAFASAPR